MHSRARILHLSSITVPLLASCGLLFELYLAHLGKSLCQTSACAVVTKFLRFGEPLLISFGAGVFLLLAGFILFAGRYSNQPLVRSMPILILIGAAAFDGTILGFQFTTLHQHCLLCITVALSLGVTALLYSASLRKWSILFSFLAAWVSGFLADTILIMPDTTETHSGMIFYEQPAAKESSPHPVATLIFSMECPHCANVLEFLAQNNPNIISWRFAITDESSESYNKLGYFYANLATSTNPFQLLLDSKKKEAKLEAKISAKFPELTREARMFLTTNGLRAIPVLVYQEVNGKTTLIHGSSNIVSFLNSLKP